MKRRNSIKNRQQEIQLFTQRTLFMGITMSVCILVLLTRLIYLQIYQHGIYTTLSWRNQVNLLPMGPARGLIFDRKGVLLAENTPIFNLVVVPNRVQDLVTTIKEVEKVIPLQQSELDQFYQLESESHSFDEIPLKTRLSEDDVARFVVNQFRFPGVHIKVQLARYYPYGAAFAHLLGYVGRIDENDLAHIDKTNYKGTESMGKLGIEKFYEENLHGTVGFEAVETDATGRAVRTLKIQEPIPGKNLTLTVDANLQLQAINALAGRRGAIVAIEPQTGEILALVSQPGFDPNLMSRGIDRNTYKTWQQSPEQPLYNRAIRGQYPLASTIKPFLALGALMDDVVDPKDSISDPGWFRLPTAAHVYRDWKKEGHGIVNLYKAIIVSCDTYFYGLSVKLGISRIAQTLNRFGFGDLTYIDVEEELPGLVATPAWKQKHYHQPWYLGDTVVAGIGQGYLLTTPLQLAHAATILANRGMAYQPHLLKATGVVAKDNPANTVPGKKVIDTEQQNWDLVLGAMKEVVGTPQGTAFARFGVAPYTTAGKTGTAQVFNLKGRERGYDQSKLPEFLRDHSLFIAFAPVENPLIAVAVVVENDKVSAPIVARQVIDFYMQEQGIMPIPKPAAITSPATTTTATPTETPATTPATTTAAKVST